MAQTEQEPKPDELAWPEDDEQHDVDDPQDTEPREEPDPIIPDTGDDEPPVIVNEDESPATDYDGWEVVEDTGKAQSTPTVYVVLEVGDAQLSNQDWSIRILGRSKTAGGDKKAIELVRERRKEEGPGAWIAVPERSFRLRARKRTMVPKDEWED